MLATLIVETPFNLLVLNGSEYLFDPFEDGGCLIRIKKPIQIGESQIEGLRVDGQEAIAANRLVIEFQKNEFDRSKKEPSEFLQRLDPPVELIARTISSFIERLRHITQSPEITAIDFPEANWRIDYTHDDGRDLPVDGIYDHMYFGNAGEFRAVRFLPDITAQLNSLPLDFKSPEWRRLLTDAAGALPHVGATITLTATALEVFIASVLDGLQQRSAINNDIWKWLNKRKDLHLNPSVEEQFDSLLKILCGHSLKEDPDLWAKGQNLRTARNKFVHEGVARFGTEVVDAKRAADFIAVAEQTIQKIKDWLPEDMRWQTFQPDPVRIQGALKQQIPQRG